MALKPVKLKLRLSMELTIGLQQQIDQIEALVDNPELLVRLLRQAAAETLLVSYRKRFLAGFSDALNMQRASNSTAPRNSTAIEKAMNTLGEAAGALADAQIAGELNTAGLERKVAKAEERLTKAYDRQLTGSQLSTGMFRTLALRVMRLLSDVGEMADRSGRSTIELGIGNVSLLESIHTPSATPMLTGHDTDSGMDVLWKHLEFGTGVYATAAGRAANPSSPHRSRKTGGWWYGPRPGFGLHLLGSKGVHALFDAGTGVPYENDALLFEDTFAAHFTRALRGGL